MAIRMIRPVPLTCGVGMVILVGNCVGAPDQKALEREFDAAYRQWRAWLDDQLKQPRHKRGDPRKWFAHEAFKRILTLGPAVVPHLVKRVKHDETLGHALYRLTKFRWHWERLPDDPDRCKVEELPGEALLAPPDAKRMWQLWWTDWRKRTPAWYTERRETWARLNRQGKKKETQEAYQRLVDLGIDALPLLMADIERGEKGLIPAVSKLTDGQVNSGLSAGQCLSWWAKHKAEWMIASQ